VTRQLGGKSFGKVCGGQTYERTLGEEVKSYQILELTETGLALARDGSAFARYRRWNDAGGTRP
jgi:hypothetical protein